MLLLGSGGSSGCCLNLGMLLGEVLLLSRMVLLGLVLLLLVLQPRRVGLGILVLMGEDVLGLRLEHCGRRTIGNGGLGLQLDKGLEGFRRSKRDEDGETSLDGG